MHQPSISTLYGPGSSHRGVLVPQLMSALDQIDAGAVPAIRGTPDAVRDLLYVADGAEAVLRAVTGREFNTEINVAAGQATTNTQIFDLLFERYGYSGPIEWKPPEAGLPVEGLAYDIERASELLGFPATSLSDGLDRLIAWRKSNHWHVDSLSRPVA